MTDFAAPGQPGAKMSYQSRYDHWIGGEFVPPAKGQYFENPTPVTGQTFCEVARGTAIAVNAVATSGVLTSCRFREATRRVPGWGVTGHRWSGTCCRW